MEKVRISPTHLKVLAAASFDAEQNVREIAARAGVQEHVAHYALKKYRDVTRVLPIINGSALGLHRYHLLFSLGAVSESEEKKFVSYLESNPKVFWVLEMGGDYQYVCGLYAKNTYCVLEFIENVTTKFKGVIRDKEFHTLLSQSNFGRKYLDPEGYSDNHITLVPPKELVEVDSIDADILTHISTQRFTSWRSVALALSLPPSTVDVRVKKLKKSGVLSRFVLAIKPEVLGREQYRMLISTFGYNSTFREDLFAYCKSHPDVVAFLQVLGRWDFEIRIEVPNNREASRFRQVLADKFSAEINSLRLIPQLRESKLCMFQSPSLLD